MPTQEALHLGPEDHQLAGIWPWAVRGGRGAVRKRHGVMARGKSPNSGEHLI
jgi:hypothetical protein